jgi:signal transduction histidine kinase
MGLRIMNYRAKLMGASLDIESADTGTIVTLKLPVSVLWIQDGPPHVSSDQTGKDKGTS